MNWKLTTLIENHEDPEGRLCCEHGLSILIESDHFRMLMDTGQTGAFYENAGKLGISLTGLNCLLLSHAHYDHAGGLLRLINQEGNPAMVYVGEHFFRKCYHRMPDGRMKYIGTKFDNRMLQELGVPVRIIKEDTLQIARGITLYRNFPQVTQYEGQSPDFFYQEEDLSCGPFGRCMDSMTYLPDDFRDETVLALDTDKGLFVIAACSHPGIVNILTEITRRSGKPILGVIGGTHLKDADEDRVRRTATDLQKLGISFAAFSHCTGDHNMAVFQEYFGDSFVYNCTGNVIDTATLLSPSITQS